MSRTLPFSQDEKAHIVMMGLMDPSIIPELCGYHNIPRSTFYHWRERFLAGGLKTLHPPGIPYTVNQEVKQIVDALYIELEVLKKAQKQGTKLNLPPSFWEGLFQKIDENDLNHREVKRVLKLNSQTFQNKRRQFENGGVLPKKQRRARPRIYRAEDYAPMIKEIQSELNPRAGSRRVYLAMKKRGAKPSQNTVYLMMKELGLIVPRPRGRSRKYYKPFKVNRPNEVWVADTTTWWEGPHRYVIYVCLDAYSRWIPHIMAATDRTALSTLRYYDQLFQQARPDALHSDRGTEFANMKGLAYLEERKIHWRHGPSHTPQSQFLVERVIQTLKDEWLMWKDADDVLEMQQHVENFRNWYNKNREHYALDYQFPSDVYHAGRKAPRKPSRRELVRRRYRRYLDPFVKGAYVEVTLRANENRETERRRLKRAADDLGLTLVFRKRRGKLLFEVKPKDLSK